MSLGKLELGVKAIIRSRPNASAAPQVSAVQRDYSRAILLTDASIGIRFGYSLKRNQVAVILLQIVTHSLGKQNSDHNTDHHPAVAGNREVDVVA